MIVTLNRRGRVTLVGAVVVLGLVLMGQLNHRQGSQVVGYAHIIDGDSIVVKGIEIRIYGIDAPEYRQICSRSGRAWPCGIEATNALRAMIGARAITCNPREEDRYGRMVAICFAGGVDIGATMVKAGNAVAYGAYDADERDARDARRGIWSSSFERPAAWRASHPRGPR